MRWRASFVVVAALGVVTACSGSATTDLFGSSSGGGADSGTEGGSSSGSSGGGGGPIDSGGGDSGPRDGGGPNVHDLPAPACNDLTQRGSFVVPTATLAAPPDPNPLTTLEPGFYTATAVMEYGTAVPTQPAEAITVAVTGNKYFYLYDDAKTHSAITTTWSLAGGELTRIIECDGTIDAGAFPPVKNRVDQAPNGYVLFTQSSAGGSPHPVAIHYSHVN